MRALPGRRVDETERALTREEMVGERERRILRATAELVAERGYLGFTVEDLLARAKVAQRTVRKLYGDKEGCYLALLDLAATTAKRKCGEAIEAVEGERQEEKIGAAIEALFEALAADPEIARACLIEPFAAGVKAMDRHRRALGELGAMLLGSAAEQPEAIAIGLGAGVLWLPERCLLDEEPRRIPGLIQEAVEFAIAARAGVEGGAKGGRLGLPRRHPGGAAGGGMGSRESPGEATLGPLPTGRHGMTHAAVQRSQRERLLAAVAEAVAERGYAATRISDVVNRAAVARRVFYENFESVEECFLAAWEIVARHLGELAAEAAVAEEGNPAQKAIAGLRAVLGFLAAEPDLARVCAVEALATGAVGQRRYREAVDGFATTLRGSLSEPLDDSAAKGSEEMAVGSTAMALSLRIAAGGVEGLPSLEPELVRLLLGPFSG